jgi:hypothetical protein
MISPKTNQKPASTAWYWFCQDLHKIDKLEPATRNNLDWFGFGYLEKHVIHVPFWSKIWKCDVKITKQGKADPNQSKLGKKSVTWI